MINYPVTKIHGHTLPTLERLLHESCDILDSDVSLNREILGGWSNINIRGSSNGLEFVLKLPGIIKKHEINPYERLNRIYRNLNDINITASPIAIGRLHDSPETPFFLLSFISGKTYDSLNEVSLEELRALKKSLELLSRQKSLDLPKYDGPLDYLATFHHRAITHSNQSKTSGEILELVSSSSTLYPSIETEINSIPSWSGKVMHGDLWMPNIIFQKGRKCILLDLESCAYGEPLYDLAYLLEASEGHSIDRFLFSEFNDDIDVIHNYRPLALEYVIDWCIERLVLMEAGMIEPNLNHPDTRQLVINYAKEKITRLKSLLS